jgi:polyphosphate:AMP phosphotransferase
MEKMLVDDGALIVKFWFHLGKDAQEKRLKSLEKKDETRWRVTPTDWKHFAMYDRFRDVSGRMLAATSTAEASWLVVEGEDARYRSLTVGNTLLELVTERINRVRSKPTAPATPVAARPPEATRSTTVLDRLDLTQTVEAGKYRKELERLQGKLNTVYRKAKEKGISTVLLFEGSDSAGKGGLIRRITPALDARDYRIIPIAAPSDEERAQHYLWRFWRHLPGKGRIAIYDRSWYGRVLVERVEGFAKPHEWGRAFAEINEFERQLVSHGIVLLKFWLHIDKDEQLRRFKEREDTPFKRFKITEEDWRNREKWDDYEIAVNEMVERTATLNAPWHLLEGNDKKFARIKALQIVHDALRKALKGD